jgi:hypothetical protein
MSQPEANANADQPQQQRGGGGWSAIIFQMLALYLVMNLLFKPKAPEPVIDKTTGQVLPQSNIRNAFPPGQIFVITWQ